MSQLLRRHPRRLVLLCLLAFVWCQTAMAAGWCNSGLVDDPAVATDCHGTAGDTSAAADDCSGCDGALDFGKLPTIAPLPAGHDYTFNRAPHLAGAQAIAACTRPRDGPTLDSLYRLLI